MAWVRVEIMERRGWSLTQSVRRQQLLRAQLGAQHGLGPAQCLTDALQLLGLLAGPHLGQQVLDQLAHSCVAVLHQRRGRPAHLPLGCQQRAEGRAHGPKQRPPATPETQAG